MSALRSIPRAVLMLGLIFVSRTAHAQTGDTSVVRSTSSGVFTAEQADRGRDIYAGLCTGCHTAASHPGGAFWDGWVGKRLSELFTFVSGRMPKSDPGSLSSEEYAALVAHILRLNGMPAGSHELPADTVVLNAIRIAGKKG